MVLVIRKPLTRTISSVHVLGRNTRPADSRLAAPQPWAQLFALASVRAGFHGGSGFCAVALYFKRGSVGLVSSFLAGVS